MSSSNGFYGQPYQPLDPRQIPPANGQDVMDPMSMGSMDAAAVYEGQTLDEIINQNNRVLQRRRDTMGPQFSGQQVQDSPLRRQSMIEFGSLNDDLADFQFDPNPAKSDLSAVNGAADSSNMTKNESRDGLGMGMKFPSDSSALGSMNNVPAFDFDNNMDLDTGHFGLTSGDVGMDFGDISGEVTSMNMQHGVLDTSLYSHSPNPQNFLPSYSTSVQDPGINSGIANDQGSRSQYSQNRQTASRPTNPSVVSNNSNITSARPPQSQPPTMNTLTQPSQTSPQHTSTSMASPHPNTIRATNDGGSMPNASGYNINTPSVRFQNVYSASGFDMLGVLMRIANRRNPEINIGPVDLSCAFVVCDITQHDMPIVYCSDIFERLTGYTKHEILGRNCRFLQAPDGRVQAGIKRRYVDDKSVLQLKNKINQRGEVQLSLINYRKGGQPFMNLLTMIPIQWDNDEYRYYIGFQVDLVEQPGSIAGRNPDGTYSINYQRAHFLPRYQLPSTAGAAQSLPDMGQTIGRDEVSTVLATIANGESELSKRIWDKVLLENTDDVVHVLSLKGLFLYLSPACRKVLEYDASELVGTALSSICHPSDIVPVTRELKDTSTGAAVSVVYRIRRKHSGYTWFESHGSLHTEQGKGRKCIILVGRERPVYAINKLKMTQHGGIGDNELWTKMSTGGMFLFVSSNVRSLLDRTPEDLIGTSAQILMRKESQLEFGRVLELARSGKTSTFKHDMQNRRGQTLQAQTTIYPGDAEEGTKPTFVVAQTRFSKMSRSMLLSSRPALSPRTDAASAGSGTPVGSTFSGQPSTVSRRSNPAPLDGITTQAGGSGMPIGNQAEALASEDNIFDELKTTRSTSWQFELRQMEKQNRLLAEELQGLLARKKKRKRRKGNGMMQKDCANCHTRVTPEWRRGPSGNRDLCNSCGLRWAKQNGRVSPRAKTGSDHGSEAKSAKSGKSASPAQLSPLGREVMNSSKTNGHSSGTAHHSDQHVSKAPRVEASSNNNFDSSMLPPKIEEGIEPPESLAFRP